MHCRSTFVSEFWRTSMREWATRPWPGSIECHHVGFTRFGVNERRRETEHHVVQDGPEAQPFVAVTSCGFVCLFSRLLKDAQRGLVAAILLVHFLLWLLLRSPFALLEFAQSNVSGKLL